MLIALAILSLPASSLAVLLRLRRRQGSDAAGRLIKIPNVITGATYTGRGQTETISYASGTATTFRYDEACGCPRRT